MGAKTKNVGGGAATAVAQDWNGFLAQGLNNNGSFGTGTGRTMGMGGAINNALSGNSMNATPYSTNWQQALGQMGQFNPASLGQVNMPQLGDNTRNIQQFSQFNPNMTPVNNVSNAQATQSFDPRMMMQGMGQNPQLGAYGTGNDVRAMAQQLAGAGGVNPDRVNMASMQQQMGGAQNAQGFQFNPFQAGGADLNGQTATAIKQIADQQLQQSLNDVRSRYSANGGQMFGTSAQFAEGQVLSQALPQLMQQLGNLNQQEAQIQGQNNALNLQGAGMANQSQQNAVGMNNAQLNANIGNQLAGTQINQQGTIAGGQLANQGGEAALNALLGLRGQDLGASGQNLQALLASRGMDINQLGMFANAAGQQDSNSLQASLANQQAGLQNRGIDANFLQSLNQFGLDQRGQDINSFMGQAGMNNQLLQMMMQGGFQQNDQQLQQQQLMQQMLGMQGNLALGGDQMMNQFQQAYAMNNSQNQMNMLQMLMGGYQQANQLGTPQRQTVQQPSGWGQALGAIGGIGGAILGGPMGGAIGKALFDSNSPTSPVNGLMPTNTMF